jgi:alpha-glucosidase (family GH31 glycosyl hydrolase)
MPFTVHSARFALVFSLALIAFNPAAIQAQSHTLESEHLTVTVTEEPYGFEVRAAQSGEVLLTHAETAFSQGIHSQTVQDAHDVQVKGRTLTATLDLAHLSHNATLRISLPRGRRATIELTHPLPDASVRVAFEDDGQHYYGIWEHTHGGGLDNRGVAHPFVGRDYQHEQVYAASIRAPFYMMSNGLGVYAETQASGHYSFGRSDTTQFRFQTGRLTYHLLYGPSYKHILREYNRLAGPPDMPPLWSMSSIWWRDDHTNIPEQVDAKNAQDLLLRDVQMLQDYRIPSATMWIDRPFTTGEWGWGGTAFASFFPDPDALAQTLRDNGMHLLYWISGRTAHELKEGLGERGLLFEGYTDKPSGDLRQTETYLYYKDFLDSLASDVQLASGETGVYGYKIDRGGEREMPDSLINKQVTLFNRAAHEQMEAHHGDNFFIFARNLYDKSRRWVAHWNGDPRDNFEGLRTSIKNGLRSGLMNFPMWGSDIGSYDKKPSKELLLRWIGFGTYSPMMEFMLEGRDQWYYGGDEQVINVTREATQTHHDLVPYTRSALYHAHQTGVPVMRAMLLEYPNDPKVTDMWNQFFYGPNLLVAPVSREGVTERDVYLPDGRWLNYNDRSTVVRGGQTVTEPAPLGTVPRFVPEGAIIPRGDILEANQSWKDDWQPQLRIEVYPARSETTSFDYYTGRVVHPIISRVTDDGIEVSFEALDHDGRLEIYAENVERVIRDGEALSGAEYEYNAEQNCLTVPFSGATTVRLPGASSLF